MKPDPAPRLVCVADAAAHMGIPVATMRRWVEAGTVAAQPGPLVDLDALDRMRLAGTLPPHRRAPRRAVPPQPPQPAGLLVSWPEVELLLGALHDGAEMRAALWVALGGECNPDANMDQAARYALMAARLRIAQVRVQQVVAS